MKYIENMKWTDTHVYFWKDNTPFSNFYKTNFSYEGKKLTFSEQGFMLRKAMLFDPSQIGKILTVKNPYEAKMAGRAVRNYNEKVWSENRYNIMVDVLKAKFSDPKLKEILLRTGNRVIVEASPYDKIWGVGLDMEDPKILDEKNWRGQNLLGKALMEVREYFKNLNVNY